MSGLGYDSVAEDIESRIVKSQINRSQKDTEIKYSALAARKVEVRLNMFCTWVFGEKHLEPRANLVMCRYKSVYSVGFTNDITSKAI